MALPMVEAGDPRCSRCGEGTDATLCTECLPKFAAELRFEIDHPDWPDLAGDTLH